MNKYKYLIFDLDDTLLDFKDTERMALEKIFKTYNIEFNGENLEYYKSINQRLWKELENGLITKNFVLTERFNEFFKRYKKNINGEDVEKEYRSYLNEGHKKIPYAKELLENLKIKGYKIYAGTNGLGETQRKRLKDSKLIEYFDDLFISEEIGFEKPNIEFFNNIFKKHNLLKKEEILMVGDSINADIKGANNAGIDSVLFNLKYENNKEVKSTYVIKNLKELENLLLEKIDE